MILPHAIKASIKKWRGTHGQSQCHLTSFVEAPDDASRLADATHRALLDTVYRP